MKKEQIINLICETHTQISEQLNLTAGYLKAFNKTGLTTDFETVIAFFNNDVVRHFKKENILFQALRVNPKISDTVFNVIEESIKEHEVLINAFKKIEEMAKRISDGETELTQDFIKKCHETAFALGKHSQVEDMVLFPEVEKRISDADFARIEQEINKTAL